MNMEFGAFSVSLSAIDEERFGHKAARASMVSKDVIPELMDFCAKNDVKFLIARCQSSEIKAAQEMERAGFLLMDTLIYYSRDLHRTPIPEDDGSVTIRPLHPGEEGRIKELAQRMFHKYVGHYHMDERLDGDKCDEAYASWAAISCVNRGPDSEVIAALSEGSILGFAALRMNSPQEGEGVLVGVSPEAQKKGISKSLMIGGLDWCLSKGADQMLISTQMINTAAQKVWTRLGFEPARAMYTFHKWFD